MRAYFDAIAHNHVQPLITDAGRASIIMATARVASLTRRGLLKILMILLVLLLHVAHVGAQCVINGHAVGVFRNYELTIESYYSVHRFITAQDNATGRNVYL